MFNTDRISLLLAVGAIVVTLGVGACSTNARIEDLSDSVNRRFDQVRADIRALRADHLRFDERLRAVEFLFGKVDQRLLTIERVVLPPASPGE